MRQFNKLLQDDTIIKMLLLVDSNKVLQDNISSSATKWYINKLLSSVDINKMQQDDNQNAIISR